MSVSTVDLVSLERILGRGNVWAFIEETARFYESFLAVADGEGRELRCTMSGRPGPRSEGVGTSREVEVFGRTIGMVTACPRLREDRMAAEALARNVSSLLREFAEQEYELNALSQEILDSYEEVNLFYDMASALSAVHDVEGVCAVILAKACEIVRVNRASILLLDDVGRELFLAAAIGIPESERETVRIAVGQGISGRVLETRVAQLVDDVGHLPRGLLAGYETYATRSFISVPLCVEVGGRRAAAGGPSPRDPHLRPGSDGTAIGVINMTDKRDGENFTSGDLKLLTALASQAAVLIQNMRLVDFEKEMRIARRIQRSLLPPALPAPPGFDIAGALVPAANLGGDYFDLLTLDGGRIIAAVVADVSGHSVASALHMAVVRSLLRSLVPSSRGPADLLERLNGLMYEDLVRAELFVSVFCCFCDLENGRLTAASAGHPPALLAPRGATAPVFLGADGILAGIVSEARFEEASVDLDVGDALLLYTDGIVDAADEAGRRFGMERLGLSFLTATRRTAAEAAAAVLDDARSFSGRRGLRDDMSAVVLKRTGNC